MSVTAGTVFRKTRTPLRKWFWMIFLITQSKHSYSILGLQRLLKIKSYKTTWLISQKIRKAMSDRDAHYKLAGIIEMDDSYFGTFRANGKRGRGSDKKSKVIVCTQINEKNKPVSASMIVVEKVDSENIKQTVQQDIQLGSKVKTDGWPAYNVLTQQGMIHDKKIIGDPKNASIILPWVHTLITNCKGTLRGTHHGISSKHLHYYLAEFCYRFNKRFKPDQLFERLVTACVITNTITWAELTR